MAAMPQPAASPPLAFNSIAIVGVGLIGGSIAAAIKARGLARTVVGVGRQTGRLEEARRARLIDVASIDLAAAGRESDLIVFCTPVDRIVAGVRELAAYCRPGTVITDAGSVKGAICRDLSDGLPEGVEFVGAHPLAGSEKAGFEFADAQLFRGRLCVLTPGASTSEVALARVREFWSGLGATLIEMSPEAHDRALAETSHLPHLLAATLAALLSDENRALTATGFRDTTRIASGDPDLWTAILLGNADELLRSLDAHQDVVNRFRDAIATHDAPRLKKLLHEAKVKRDALAGGPTNNGIISPEQ